MGSGILRNLEFQDACFALYEVDGLLDGLGRDLGMALFCQFVDIGDGGGFGGGFLVEFDVAKGAIGL